MTKEQWVSYVKNTIMKIDEQGMYREPLLIRHISSVHEQMFNELYRRDPRHFSKYSTLVTETVGVDGDDLTAGRELPTIPISLPRTNGGVFDVVIDGSQTVMTTYEAYYNDIQASFDNTTINGFLLSTILQDTLYVNNDAVLEGDVISYRMIPKFSELSATDEVKVPEGHEEMMLDRIIETLRQIPPTDYINDNTIQ